MSVASSPIAASGNVPVGGRPDHDRTLTSVTTGMTAQIIRTYGAAAVIAILALHVAVVVSLLAGSGSGRHKCVWTAVVLLLPVVGVVLYVLWGRSTRDRPLLE